MEPTTSAYWTHGVNTIAEFPERCISIRRTGYGTIVQQGEDVPEVHNNWFHQPLHTVIGINDQYSKIVKVKFHIKLNEFAVLREIHVRYGHELIYDEEYTRDKKEISRELLLGKEDEDGTMVYPSLSGIGPEKLQSGLTLCLRIEFIDGPMPGEVIFYGSGLSYVL